MAHIKFDRSILNALAVIAPTDEIRQALNGILFDVKSCNLVASGSCRIALSAPGTVISDGILSDFIMPIAFVKAMLKDSKKGDIITVYVDQSYSPFKLECSKFAVIKANAIDGRYLDWRRVYTAGQVDKTARPVYDFNPDFITNIRKIANALGAKKGANMPKIETGFKLCAWVNFYDVVHYGLMPLMELKPTLSRFDVDTQMAPY